MREAWIDRWKGVLILMVVLGHVVGGGAHLATGNLRTFFEGIYRIIYLFHMPAFFAVAGYCWHSRTDSLRTFAWKKVKRLLLPYVVFGGASVIIYLTLQKAFLAQVGSGVGGHYVSMGGESWWQPFVSLLHAGGWPKGEGFRANSVLWFLPCLFTVEVIYAVIDRLLPQRRSQLLLSVLLLLLGYGVNRYLTFELPWGLGLAAWYLPFLIWGRWSVRRLLDWLFACSDQFPRGVCAVILLCTLLFCWRGWHMPSQYFKVHLGWYFVFAGMALVGIVLGAFWARWAKNFGLEHFGVISLTIMLVHKFPVLLFQMKIGVVRDLFTGGLFFGGGIGVAFVTVLALALAELVHYALARWVPWSVGQTWRKRI